MKYTVVVLEDDPHRHVIGVGQFWDGEGKALCGRKPFPQKWAESDQLDSIRRMCAGCANAYRARS